MVLILRSDNFIANFKPLATSLLIRVKCDYNMIEWQLNKTSLPYRISNFFIVISISNTKSIMKFGWIVNMRTKSTKTIASTGLNMKTIVTTWSLIFNTKIVIVLINFNSDGGASGSLYAFNKCRNWSFLVINIDFCSHQAIFSQNLVKRFWSQR